VQQQYWPELQHGEFELPVQVHANVVPKHKTDGRTELNRSSLLTAVADLDPLKTEPI